MRYMFGVFVAFFFVIFLADSSIYAGRVFTDSDLEQYGSGSSDSTSGSDTDTGRGSADTGDEDKAIRLCTNAVKAGITVYGRHSGVKSVKLIEVTPSAKAADLLYIIDFDAHLDHDIISRVECWVYKKHGEFTYRIISKE
ncbi:MAG: hypothetical protein AB1442_13610 [Nitrospirota bacterium]